jgi:hypothetical protein
LNALKAVLEVLVLGANPTVDKGGLVMLGLVNPDNDEGLLTLLLLLLLLLVVVENPNPPNAELKSPRAFDANAGGGALSPDPTGVPTGVPVDNSAGVTGAAAAGFGA